MNIYVHLIIASLFWGTNVILMKFLLAYIPFLLLAFLRVLFSFLCFFFYFKISRRKIKKVSLKRVFLLAFIGIYLNFLFTFLGMGEVKGIDNALLNALSPILMICIQFLFFHQSIDKKEFIAVGLSLFGFLLSIRFQLFSLKIGFYLMFLGMFCYLMSYVLLHKWDIKNNFDYLLFQEAIGACLLFVHLYFFGNMNVIKPLSFSYWVMFFIISGVGFAYIQVIYMKATQTIGIVKTSFFMNLSPIVTYVESLFFLKEEIDMIHMVAFFMLMSGLLVINKKALLKKKRDDMIVEKKGS